MPDGIESMHRFFSFLVFGLCVHGVRGAEEPMPVTAAEAVKLIGRSNLVVEMVVKKSKERLEKRGIIFLDSEEDFKDPKNLGIAISADAAVKFKQKGIDHPGEHFKDKAIRVRGCVMKFEENPYLVVHDPAQITLVGNK
jgi:hypothetical protein